MRIRIEATDLPGRCFHGPVSHDNVHVGVQRRNRPGELLDLQPGDAASAAWTLDSDTSAGNDVTGPYIQGPPGGRFLYLSWVVLTSDGAFEMFRRAKLMLADVDPQVLSDAARADLLVGRLALTDDKGHPVCARVRPPAIQWSAGGG